VYDDPFETQAQFDQELADFKAMEDILALFEDES
jgi:hypothetical protein